MKYAILLALLALAGCSADAAETELRPTIATCSAAFSKSDEPQDAQAAVKLGLLGFVKFTAKPEAERLAYETRFKAERARAMALDTSRILKECRAQLRDPDKLGG